MTPAPAVLDYDPDLPSDRERWRLKYGWWLSHREAPAELCDQDRRRYNLGLRVHYPEWERRVDDAVAAILEDNNDKVCLFVEGPARAGKTSFAVEVALRVCHLVWRERGEVIEGIDEDIDVIPVIVVKGSTGQTADFMRDCLRAAGLPPRGTANDMLAAFGRFCRKHGVRLLLVDDIHVTTSREAGNENFYKRLLDVVPAIMFTAVDFDQSPLPRPATAPPRRRATLEQLWERGVLFSFPAIDTSTQAGKVVVARAIRSAIAALRLERQSSFDLGSAATVTALLERHHGLLGAMLGHIAKAAAKAVGTTEGVGHEELGLRIAKSTVAQAS